MEGLLYGLTLGVKTCVMIFVFIWARVSFPRIRFECPSVELYYCLLL
jgi:NADH-ubiquinone oxidoreductase chain 1